MVSGGAIEVILLISLNLLSISNFTLLPSIATSNLTFVLVINSSSIVTVDTISNTSTPSKALLLSSISVFASSRFSDFASVAPSASLITSFKLLKFSSSLK